MEILRFNIHTPIECRERITACIGYFDGLHLGHQQLVKRVLEIAEKTHTIPALITFDPDPWVVLKKLHNIPHITPMNHRQDIGAKLGIQKWIILDFQKDMAQLSYEQFHELVLKPLHIETLVCGYDFHYANRGEGSVKTLQAQHFFKVEGVEEIASANEKISSTRIEQSIKRGEMEETADNMGRFYEMRGIVKSGNRVGRKYGFPTANLKTQGEYIMPKQGVYIGSVFVLDTWWMAIINVGHNPSFNYQQNTSIEAYLLDFDKMIYDKTVTFRFHRFLREEQKFAGMQELKEQLLKDCDRARNYFRQRKEG